MKNFIFFATILISFQFTLQTKSKILNQAQLSDQEDSVDPQIQNQSQILNAKNSQESVEDIFAQNNASPSKVINNQSPSKLLNNQEISQEEDLSQQSPKRNTLTQNMANALADQFKGQMQNNQNLLAQSPQKLNTQPQMDPEIQPQVVYKQPQVQNNSASRSISEQELDQNDQTLITPGNQIITKQPQETLTNLRQTEDLQDEFRQADQFQLRDEDFNQNQSQIKFQPSQNNAMLQDFGANMVNQINQYRDNIQNNQQRTSWVMPEDKKNDKPQIQNQSEIQEPQIQEKPVLKNQQELNQKDQKELLRFQKYQNNQFEKSKQLRRSNSFAIKKENGNSCSKELLLTFGLTIDQNRQSGDITPMPSGVKEKTLCRRNMGTCCTYDEMMSVADQFAETANKFREQFIVLEELYVMFKGTKIFDVLNDLKQIDKCKAMMDSHVLIPKDAQGNPQGGFETSVAIEIQNSVAGLFNEMRRYKKHIISTYGNVVCSICSPSESKYFKLDQDKKLSEIDVTFANCQELMDLKDFEIRVAEVYQKYLLPLVAVMECDGKEDDPKVDEMELDQIINDRKLFDDCFNNFNMENPNCQGICTEFDIKTYTFPGNFFKVSKQMLAYFYNKFAKGNIEEYYEEYKDRDFKSFANYQHYIFFPALKVPEKQPDQLQVKVKLVESNGINITNDYINRIFLEHKQHEKSYSMINAILTFVIVLFF